MAQTQVRDHHREAAEDKYQRTIRQWNVLGKELCARTGQANRGDQTGDENQRRQQEASCTAKGVLNIRMQNRRAVSRLIDQNRAI